MSIIITTVLIAKKTVKKKTKIFIFRKEIYNANDFIKDLILDNVNIFNLEYKYNGLKNFYGISSIELNIY